MKKILIYDSSFDGFLSAVYQVFEQQLKDVEIVKPKHFEPNIFIESETVDTNSKQAKRVWHGLQLKIGKSRANRLYACFLSEIKGVENVMMRYILWAYCSESFKHSDHSNKDVLRVDQVSKMVFRERDRMEAIVTFQLTKEGIYFANIEPDFNVLPLLLKYYENKFPDRRWIIFDKKRMHGIQHSNHMSRYISKEEFMLKTKKDKIFTHHFGNVSPRFKFQAKRDLKAVSGY